jgi:hypothetical protein
LQLTRRVRFAAGLRWFSATGADHIHNASAGGRNRALVARKVFVVLLEELGHGHGEGIRYLAEGLGARL